MTTEYYQIPSQQGFLPLESSAYDPWLASTTSSLSLSDWASKGKSRNPPSLFEPGDVEAVSWKHVVPMQTAASPKTEAIKAPKISPKQFNSTASKIDAWSVVESPSSSSKQKRTAKSTIPSVVLSPTPAPAPASIRSPAPTPAVSPIPAPAATTVSPPTAAPDTEDKPVEDELTHQNRYKTELCKSFTETGVCRYGAKCQFAHGKEEIRPILRHPKYKTEICKTFHTTGTCPYGIRCRFIHTRSKDESAAKAQAQAQAQAKAQAAALAQLQVVEEEETEDEETSVTPAPPGIPVAQWSKSWNMSTPPVLSKSIRPSQRLAQPEPAF